MSTEMVYTKILHMENMRIIYVFSADRKNPRIIYGFCYVHMYSLGAYHHRKYMNISMKLMYRPPMNTETTFGKQYWSSSVRQPIQPMK